MFVFVQLGLFSNAVAEVIAKEDIRKRLPSDTLTLIILVYRFQQAGLNKPLILNKEQ